MVKINCKQAIEIPKRILSTTGLWPTLTITKYYKSKLIFNLIFNLTVLTLIFLNIINAVKSNNIRHLNWMTCILIAMVNYSAKSFTLFGNKKYFLSLLEDLNSEIFNSHNEKLNENVKLIYRFSKLMMKYFALTLASYLTITSFLPLIINIGLMIPAPFETGKWNIIYRILHFLATIHMAVNSTCFDVIFLTLIGLCVAQLNILEEKLNFLLEDALQISTNAEDVKVMIKCSLRECIILHELINKFVKKLGTVLSFPLFIQYSCGCFIICNTILQMTIMGEAGSSNIASICTFSGITFGQMTAYHWIGNEVTFKSNKIIESCFTSKWYQLDINSQKSLLLLMERAKRPLIVQLYKFVFISLDSLGVIVKWSYSIFALIKAKYK